MGQDDRRALGHGLPGRRTGPRHPSQLYEAALEGLVLFVVLALLVRAGALRRRGTITGMFAVGYGLARIVCDPSASRMRSLDSSGGISPWACC